METNDITMVEGRNRNTKRLLLLGLTMLFAMLLAAPSAMAQSTPFESQYAPPTAPPPPSECADDHGSATGSGDAEDCEDLEVLPATGGLSSLPFSAIAPAALLGAGIVTTTGIIAIRRRR